MIVRLRLPPGRPLRRRLQSNVPLALPVSALLEPLTLMAYAIGVWRLGFDLGMVHSFPLTGFWAHWQVWIAVAVGLHLAAYKLADYGNRVMESERLAQRQAADQSAAQRATAVKQAERYLELKDLLAVTDDHATELAPAQRTGYTRGNPAGNLSAARRGRTRSPRSRSAGV